MTEQLPMFKITGLNHVGIAVSDLNEVVSMFETKLGLRVSNVVEYEPSKLKVGLVDTGNCVLELMEPMDKKDNTVAKFLEKQGRNAIHHIAFSVNSDLEKVAEQLRDLGVSMIYLRSRVGVMGHPVNFCHPKFTSDILVELCYTD